LQNILNKERSTEKNVIDVEVVNNEQKEWNTGIQK
jgi:hypothetical protein